VTVERLQLVGTRLSGSIIFGNPRPIDMALSVFVEIDGTEVLVENVERSAETATVGQHARSFGGEWLGDPPTQVTIILRGSRDAALDTPDMFEIWDGELRFEDLPVEEVLTPTTTPAAIQYIDSDRGG